jgi:hypothetical protein
MISFLFRRLDNEADRRALCRIGEGMEWKVSIDRLQVGIKSIEWLLLER